MSQSNYNIPNQSAPAVRAQLNSVFGSVATNNSGSAAPATTFAYQWWYDTTTNTLKMRNAANSGWIEIGTFDQGSGTFSPSGVVMPDIASEVEALAGTDNTKMMTPLRDRQALEALAEGAAGAPRVQGLALSGRMFGPVTGSDPVGFTSLDGVAVVTLNWQGSVYQDRYMQVRFTNNGGSSWGSYQNITAPAGYAGKFGGVTTINLLTGDFVTAIESPMNYSGTLTVPSGVNGIQIANSSTSATDMAVVLLIEEGVV